MMLPAPRIIAVDDEPEHLSGLTDGLNRYGTACLPIHFTGETEDIPACPHVRVIFADLHLSGGTATDHAQDFSTIGGLIESTIRPSGPYVVILWTRYPDQAVKLHQFLQERLQKVTKPFAVQPLDKSDHLDATGRVKNTDKLIESITTVLKGQSQIAALLNWDERVSDAAADTVSSILTLTETADMSQRNEEAGRFIASLAAEAVGREHVEKDRFRAVNEALLPILADRLASMRSRDTDSAMWRAAFAESDIGHGLSPDKAAKLNRLLHIATLSTDGSTVIERGVVIDLPEEFSGDAFGSVFDLAPETAAHKQFGRKGSGRDNNSFHWVLVQTQAACDYAQTQPGPLPFHLGLVLPKAEIRKGTLPAALWTSPGFELDANVSHLHVNARFQLSLPNAKAAEATPLFRLREQLLNDLIYRLHSYGARPGVISFRSS